MSVTFTQDKGRLILQADTSFLTWLHNYPIERGYRPTINAVVARYGGMYGYRLMRPEYIGALTDSCIMVLGEREDPDFKAWMYGDYAIRDYLDDLKALRPMIWYGG